MAPQSRNKPEGLRLGLRRTIMGVVMLAAALGLWLLAEEVRLSLSALRAIGANAPYLVMLVSVALGILGFMWLFNGLLRTGQALLSRRESGTQARRP